MLFEFENQGHKDQIFDLSPWSIQVQCLSLHKQKPNVVLAAIDFKNIQFWVQIHDVGLEKFIESAQRIENSIGEYVETYKDAEDISNSHLRLKVVVDTEKPLMAGFWLDFGGRVHKGLKLG